jgi:hypothetical protein
MKKTKDQSKKIISELDDIKKTKKDFDFEDNVNFFKIVKDTEEKKADGAVEVNKNQRLIAFFPVPKVFPDISSFRSLIAINAVYRC